MNGTTSSAYIVGAIIMIVCLCVAMIGSMMVDDANLNTRGKRKAWLWALAVATPVIIFGVCYFCFYSDIKVPNKKAAYMTATGISCAAEFVIYLVLAFVLSKVGPRKLDKWF